MSFFKKKKKTPKNEQTNKQTKLLITFYQTHGHPHFLFSLHWQVITSNTFFVLCSFVDGHIGGRRFEGWKKNLPRCKRRKKIKVLLNKLCIHQCVHTISVNCNQYKTKMNIKNDSHIKYNSYCLLYDRLDLLQRNFRPKYEKRSLYQIKSKYVKGKSQHIINRSKY